MSATKPDVTLMRSRPALTRIPRWWPYAALIAITAPLTVFWWGLVADGSVAFDWRIFVQAGERFWAQSPDLYQVNDFYSFRHSPIMAMAMPAVAWIGTVGIRLVTAAAALALPTWPMRLLALASFPFVMDLQHGALLTVITLAAAWALMGSRAGAVAFVILALLSPRPLMLPIVGYLLWKQPWLRLPSLGLFVAHALAVLATGYADDWVYVLLFVSSDMLDSPFNLAPSRLIGRAWLPIAFAVSGFLLWRGRVGLASVVINPYVLPHYLLLSLLELRPRRSPS